MQLPTDRLVGLQRRVKLLRDIEKFSRLRDEAAAHEANATLDEQRSSEYLRTLRAALQQLESSKAVPPHLTAILAHTPASASASASAGAGGARPDSGADSAGSSEGAHAAAAPRTPARSTRKRGSHALADVHTAAHADGDTGASMEDEAAAGAAAAPSEQPNNRQRTQATRPAAAAMAAAAAPAEPIRATRRSGFQDQAQDMHTIRH